MAADSIRRRANAPDPPASHEGANGGGGVVSSSKRRKRPSPSRGPFAFLQFLTVPLLLLYCAAVALGIFLCARLARFFFPAADSGKVGGVDGDARRLVGSWIPEPRRLERDWHVHHPFELNWDGEALPSWAKKKVNYAVPRGKEVCFVHVGKAGGSTVGCSLGFSLYCEGREPAGGALPKLTTHLFHMAHYDCYDDAAHYLFLVRDPLDRARSAFNWDRPGDPAKDNDDDDRFGSHDFYTECPFLKLEDFVRDGIAEGGAASEECRKTARDALQGRQEDYGLPAHFFYNYQYYYESVPKDASILVVRNEHLEEDWNEIEDMLSGGRRGGNGNGEAKEKTTFPRNNANTWSNEGDYRLSDASRAALCRALCHEMRQYEAILRRARNLDERQLKASLEELGKKCPEVAGGGDGVVGGKCPEPLPDIRHKLENYRGGLEGGEGK
ncbi:hypothetical protein ACHAWF_006031 [Thalassiosira exigua]